MRHSVLMTMLLLAASGSNASPEPVRLPEPEPEPRPLPERARQQPREQETDEKRMARYARDRADAARWVEEDRVRKEIRALERKRDEERLQAARAVAEAEALAQTVGAKLEARKAELERRRSRRGRSPKVLR